MALPGRPPRHDPPVHVAQSDRRWFLVLAAGFVVSIGGLLSLHAIYRATGPHRKVTIFLRTLKRQFRHLVPRFRRR